MVDLESLDTSKAADEGIFVQLYNPSTKEDLGIFIGVYGIDSEVYRKTSRETQNQRIKASAKRGATGTLTSEKMEADDLRLLVNCTFGWKVVDGEETINSINLGGEELVFSSASCLALYKRFSWIKEQVDTAIADRSLFIKG